MSTLTAITTELPVIPMAELEAQQQQESHKGQDLRDPEAAACPGTTPIDTNSAGVQHTIVHQTPAVPYFKLLVAGFSYLCAGVNDGTLGPLIPHIIDTFHIGTGEVAIM